MKKSTCKAIKKLANITSKKCIDCPVEAEFKCCAKMFCDKTKEFLIKNNIKIEETKNKLPYMGDDNKCIVPPEYRPFCSCYICIPFLAEDKVFFKEYFDLFEKVQKERESCGELPDLFKIKSQTLRLLHPDRKDELARDIERKNKAREKRLSQIEKTN